MKSKAVAYGSIRESIWKWADAVILCVLIIVMVGLTVISIKAEQSHHILLDSWISEVHGNPKGTSLGDKVYAGLESEVSSASSLIARYNSGGIDETQLTRGILLIESRINSISDELMWGTGRIAPLHTQPKAVANSIDKAMVAALTKDPESLSEAQGSLVKSMNTAHERLAGYDLKNLQLTYVILAISLAVMLISVSYLTATPDIPKEDKPAKADGRAK